MARGLAIRSPLFGPAGRDDLPSAYARLGDTLAGYAAAAPIAVGVFDVDGWWPSIVGGEAVASLFDAPHPATYRVVASQGSSRRPDYGAFADDLTLAQASRACARITARHAR